MTKNIHFITYGNDVFEKAKQRLLLQAKDFYPFKTITGYGPNDLPANFKKNFKNILDMKRGGGYWIWRPIILYKKLYEMQENEFLIYLDAGCHLNKNGMPRFMEYIDLLAKSEYGAMSFQMSGNKGPGGLEKEKYWTTSEIFNYFQVEPTSESDICNNDICNNYIYNSGQYLGGILVLKKNKHLMHLLDLFIKALNHDPLMFTDHYNTMPQHPEFKENRHEQSVFSILRKLHGSVVIEGDESWMVPFGQGESLKYPFWAARSKT